ncbi:MAG: hypothetical protein AAFP68_18230 [Pseudomonadota bacterium]
MRPLDGGNRVHLYEAEPVNQLKQPGIARWQIPTPQPVPGQEDPPGGRVVDTGDGRHESSSRGSLAASPESAKTQARKTAVDAICCVQPEQWTKFTVVIKM